MIIIIEGLLFQKIIKNKLKKLGVFVNYYIEGQRYAKYKNDDAYVARINSFIDCLISKVKILKNLTIIYFLIILIYFKLDNYMYVHIILELITNISYPWKVSKNLFLYTKNIGLSNKHFDLIV